MPWELIGKQVGEIMEIGIDREIVQLGTVICGTIIAVGCLVFDGDLGYAMGTALISSLTGVVGYVFGSSVKGDKGNDKSEDLEEVKETARTS